MALGRQSSAQRSVYLIPPKGNEPREGVFDSCCETPIVCLRAGSGSPSVSVARQPGHMMWLRRVRSAPTTVWPHGLGWSVGDPRRGDTRKRGHLSGRVGRLRPAVSHGVHVACCVRSTGDGRTRVAGAAWACSSPRSESHPTGTISRRQSFLRRAGSEARCECSNEDRRACVSLMASSPPRASFQRRRWLAIAGRVGARKRATWLRPWGSLGRSGSGPRDPTATSASVHGRSTCFGGSSPWVPTAPLRRSDLRVGSRAGSGPKPARRCRSERMGPARERTLES
jgi:hypothetical protein